jgi:hypothetical protein
MGLADYEPERFTVNVRNKPLMEVRGLNLDDVSVLIRQHLPEIEKLYDLAGIGQGDVFKRISQDGFMVKIVADMPELASRLIAMAADEPASHQKAKLLPIPVQIIALQAIVRLTFEDIGGPKAFVALLEKVTGRPLPATLTQASATS